MTYAAKQDLVNRLGSADRLEVLLADESGNERQDALEAALAAADDELDSLLGQVLPFPLTGTVPALVKAWAADLALAALAQGRPAAGGGQIAANAERTRGQIEEARAGRRRIPGIERRSAVGGVPETGRSMTRGEDNVDGSGGTLDVL